jgi:hypothetical protein
MIIIFITMHTSLFHLHKVLYKFPLTPPSFKCLDTSWIQDPLIAHKQISFPIAFGGIRLILTTTIALIAYLGRWTFIVSIITIKFIVDQHPFLIEPLA